MPRRKIRRRTKRRRVKRKQVARGRRLSKRTGGTGSIIGDYMDYKNLLGGAAAIAAGAFPESKTQTKTKEEWQVNEADGIKYKTHSITYKKSKLARLTQKLSQKGMVYDYSASGVASGQGNQQAGVVSSTVGANITALYETLNNGVAMAARQDSNKLYFGTAMHEMEFSNAGNTTLEFDIYILIDKVTQPLATSPGAIWDAAILAEANDVLAPGETKTDLWTLPTSFKLFNINYWTKKLRCSLTPGENCKLKFRFNLNRLLDTQYPVSFQAIRGITHHVMVVTRGTLGDSTQTLAVTAFGQTITPSKLIWVLKRTWSGSILSTLPRVNKQLANELPSLLATLYAQDEDSGLVENSMLAANYA